MTMRVAIDGGALRFPHSGIRTYLSSLIEELQQPGSPVDVALLAPGDPDERWTSGPLTRAARFWWDSMGAGRAAGRSGADLLHLPQFSAPLRSRLPYVVTVHDLIPLVLPEYRQSRSMRLMMEVMKRTVPRAQALIVPSEFVAREVVDKLGVIPDLVRVAPMGVSTTCTPATPGEPIPKSLTTMGIRQPYLFNIAGFDARKNLGVLVEAFGEFLRTTGLEAQLVIGGAPHTGNPDVFPPIAPVIDRLGLGSRVLLPGRLSEADKIDLYRHAWMYVTPSRYEGFGMTALEAMACGAPVIAGNRTSLPEVTGAAALLVSPDKAHEVTAAMQRIAADPQLAAELVHKGLERAKRFTWPSTARLTIEAYRAALERF